MERGLWTEERSLETSRTLIERLLPQGRETPGCRFYVIVSEDGTRIGETWYSLEEEGGKKRFWVEWITIDPPYRRRGYASDALRLLQDEARGLGADSIGLNVWADNPEAIRLYSKLGYTVLNMSMSKSTASTR